MPRVNEWIPLTPTGCSTLAASLFLRLGWDSACSPTGSISTTPVWRRNPKTGRGRAFAITPPEPRDESRSSHIGQPRAGPASRRKICITRRRQAGRHRKPRSGTAPRRGSRRIAPDGVRVRPHRTRTQSGERSQQEKQPTRPEGARRIQTGDAKLSAGALSSPNHKPVYRYLSVI